MTAREVLTAVAATSGLSVELLRGPRRWSELVNARRVAAVMLRDEGFSYPAIGRALGGRHHTTAMNLCGVFAPLPKEVSPCPAAK